MIGFTKRTGIEISAVFFSKKVLVLPYTNNEPCNSTPNLNPGYDLRNGIFTDGLGEFTGPIQIMAHTHPKYADYESSWDDLKNSFNINPGKWNLTLGINEPTPNIWTEMGYK